ncbi:hypothetical protein MVEN_00953500 [Mycena venus]|uniref:F-box domain-containing protein n=1 Tax=Mycena venus TaxID=2733690 RepID=A0A8H6YCI6_9AGAR|nr:hypothetical protein MVEN_00953500 [Mycena venus]
MDLPREIVDAIVDELDHSSVHVFCLVTRSFVRPSQARIFRSLHIQLGVNRPSSSSSGEYRPISPQQAQRLFASSPHIASYVQRLWVDIPLLQGDVGPPIQYLPARTVDDYYPPLQTFLPNFTRVRQLLVSAPSGKRWTDLPKALKDAIQTIILLPSLSELQLSYLSIPTTLIASLASVSELTLFSVEIEDTKVESSPMALASVAVSLYDISESMATFLATPGALPMRHLSIIYPAQWQWANIRQILQGTAATLNHLRFVFVRPLSAVPFPYLRALRVLELESSAGPGPYCLPDEFVLLLTQIPNTMPSLEKVILHLSIPYWDDVERGSEIPWAHSRPFDMGPLGAVHCRLRFNEFESADFSEARRELYEKVYQDFVRCMGEQMPALRDSGGLSFSHCRIAIPEF